MISGYFQCRKESVSIRKSVQLVVETIIISMALVIINAVINKETITARGILALLVPRNYYVVLFVAMTLLSPYLNWFISKLSKKQFEGFLILALLLFSVQPTFIDILEGLEGETFPGTSTIGISGSQWGYTIVTFLLMYFIGA